MKEKKKEEKAENITIYKGHAKPVKEWRFNANTPDQQINVVQIAIVVVGLLTSMTF